MTNRPASRPPRAVEMVLRAMISQADREMHAASMTAEHRVRTDEMERLYREAADALESK